METKVLTAHVPLPLAEKVDQIAARLERSRGWIVKQALTALGRPGRGAPTLDAGRRLPTSTLAALSITRPSRPGPTVLIVTSRYPCRCDGA